MIRGVIALGSSTLIKIVISFTSVTIAARVIPEADFGAYFLLLSIVFFLGIIGNMGLQVSAAKFVASAETVQERQTIVNNLLTFRVLIVLGLCGIALFGKPLILLLFSSQLIAKLYLYAPLLFALQLTDETLSFIMQGYQLYRGMALVQVLASLIQFLATVLFLLWVNLGVEGYLLANILSTVIIVVLRFWMIPGTKRWAFDLNLIRRLVQFGLPLQGNDFLTFVFAKLDVMLLGAMMGTTQIAYLEVAAKIPNQFRSLYAALQSVYFPQLSELFARKRRMEAEAVLDHTLRLSGFITLFSALIFVLFQQEIILLVFSEKYLVCAPALGLMMIIVAIGVVSTILDTALISDGHPAYLLVINVVTAGVSLLANLTLLPLFGGFMGAVYARLAANSASYPVSVWCLHRTQIMAPVSDTLKTFSCLFLCLGINYLLAVESFVVRGCLLLLFILLCFVCSVIRQQDVALFVNSIGYPWRKKRLLTNEFVG